VLAEREEIMEETKIEPLVLTEERKQKKKKGSGEDCIFLQCLLSIVLMISIFSLRWIHPQFQAALLEQYQTKLYAPAEAFLTQILTQIEQWVH
jgi:hypothetical protein